MSSHWLIAPSLLVLAAMCLVPLGMVVIESLRSPAWGLQNYEWALTTRVNLELLARTLVTALVVTGACLLIGYPYALALLISGPKVRTLLLLAVVVPFWVSTVARTFAWVILLQDTGPINDALGALGLGPVPLIRTYAGMSIAMAQIMLPFMILPLYASMRNIDLRLVDAAESLGARPARSFMTIFAPLSKSGIVAGSVIVFTLTLGFYLVPLLIGGPTKNLLSGLIHTQTQVLLNFGRAGALSVMLLSCLLVMLVVGGRFVVQAFSRSGDNSG